ncbi:hypothetical protein PWT90_00498 [Aphanocladium album]|nr:hypothetical protein PWT90_00498 [Aphanocladium album]
MPLSNRTSKQAREVIQRAYKELENAVSVQDAHDFNNTTIEGVRKACQLLENELGARGLLRNMGRLEPLMKGLECYGKVVDTLCQGTPFLPWIWAPIVAILKIGADCIHAFETLIKAYAQIGRSLARFENLRQTFKEDACFQEIVAIFYRDVVKFHTCAYKFLTVNGWGRFFRTTWGRFERQFNAILDSLDRHGELIDREASARNIADTQLLLKQLEAERKERLDKISSDQKAHTARCYQEIIARLQVNESDQNSIWETLIGAVPAGSESTCAWTLKHEKIGSWLNNRGTTFSLWIQGAAGTGKSVVAAHLARFRSVNDHVVIRHFCNDLYESSTKYEEILKSLIRQLSAHSDDAIAYIHNSLMNDRKTLTISALELMVEEMVTIISGSRKVQKDIWIIIDGVDTCETTGLARCIALMGLVAAGGRQMGANVCKVLFTSRHESPRKDARRGTLVRLGDESASINKSIYAYTARRLQLPPTSDRLSQLGLSTEEVTELANEISGKAAGKPHMSSKILFHTNEDLRQALRELPPELKGFYQKIVSNIVSHLSPASIESVKCVLQWIAFSIVPMGRLELLSAVTFSLRDESADRLVPSYIVQDCFALLEERPDKTIAYIHATVKDFLLDADSAFSLDTCSAQRQLTLGTLTCLSAAAQAFSLPNHTQAAELLAVRGLFAFLNSASKHWTIYLIAYAEKCHEQHYRDSKIDNVAAGLAQKLQRVRAGNNIQLGDGVTNLKEIGSRVGCLQHIPAILPFASAALASQASVFGEKNVQNSASAATVIVSHDATAEILHRYRIVVLRLLQQNSYLGISREDFERFKKQAQTALFTCSLNSCPRASVGFQTEAECLTHELEHSQYYPCLVDGCQLPPFKSRSLLERHRKRYHEPNAERRRLKRVDKISSIANASWPVKKGLFTSRGQPTSDEKPQMGATDARDGHWNEGRNTGDLHAHFPKPQGPIQTLPEATPERDSEQSMQRNLAALISENRRRLGQAPIERGAASSANAVPKFTSTRRPPLIRDSATEPPTTYAPPDSDALPRRMDFQRISNIIDGPAMISQSALNSAYESYKNAAASTFNADFAFAPPNLLAVAQPTNQQASASPALLSASPSAGRRANIFKKIKTRSRRRRFSSRPSQQGAPPRVSVTQEPSPASAAVKPATTDPVIALPAQKAFDDPELRGLMKRAAVSQAKPDELAHFQKMVVEGRRNHEPPKEPDWNFSNYDSNSPLQFNDLLPPQDLGFFYDKYSAGTSAPRLKVLFPDYPEDLGPASLPPPPAAWWTTQFGHGTSQPTQVHKTAQGDTARANMPAINIDLTPTAEGSSMTKSRV